MPKHNLNHIYWFAYYNLDSPSVRYRAQYPLDFAKEHLHISSQLVMPGYSWKNLVHFGKTFLSALLCTKEESLIVVQRVQSNFLYANLLRLLVKAKKGKCVYDLDDADYLEHNDARIHFFARNCNYISAGSKEIATYMKKYNQNVAHITSPILDLGIVKQTRNQLFTIGWVGGFSWGHRESLLTYVFPAIRALQFSCRFILLGITRDEDEKEIRDFFQASEQVELFIPRDVAWHNEEAIQQQIVEFDIGIATLLDTPYQLAKSGIKAKQYMNNGVPVLCNDLPENNNVIVHGINGLICNTEHDFFSALVRFKHMSDVEYEEFSNAARSSIKHFNHKKYFEELVSLKNHS